MVSRLEQGSQVLSALNDYELDALRSSARIFDLPTLVENLPPPEQKVFGRIFRLRYSEAPLSYSSPEARSYVAERFKVSEIDLKTRRTLRIENLVLEEGTRFNLIRSHRPLQQFSDDGAIERLREKNPPEKCDLCDWRDKTSMDPFGRVEGKYSVTVANAGAYTAWNSFVAPKEHDPLQFTEEVLADMIQTGNEWFKEANRYFQETNGHDQQLLFPSIKMNLLPRAGASIFHPHLHVMLEEDPNIKLRALNKRMANYQYKHGFPYLDDLAFALRPLGLVYDLGSAHIIFNPTPLKEGEVLIYSNDGNGLPNGDLSKAIYQILNWWRNDLKATSSNLAFFLPPLGIGLRENGDWFNFFPFARTLERGPEGRETSDFGAMEIYDLPVVSSDPFVLSRRFREFLSNSRNSSGSSD